MKNPLLHIIYRCIVGSEYGFTGEGNEQWYYSLAIAINLMLTWLLQPKVTFLFTTISLIHYLVMFIYGFFELVFSNVVFSYLYLGIHLILFATAIFASFHWTVITIAIITLALFLAPDCTGNNIFLHEPHSNSRLLLMFNTIIFAVFVGIDFILPIKLWIKLVIILTALILHPIIDFFAGEGVIITDITSDVIFKIKEDIDNRKKH